MSYFNIKKQAALQEISMEMNTLLSNLEDLNGYLKDSVALGQQFKNISSLWNTFYDCELQMREVVEGAKDRVKKLDESSEEAVKIPRQEGVDQEEQQPPQENNSQTASR
ncbi:hypothetical protein DASC09_020150 [Saccharomycopsis crataegensis]|uniref:DASH complex subunit DAD1 n=1 Tax=Saccharomycopsis crataegensis TaxID=43959 RepID=A0AAV5QIC4_9ASCO|nr:hypothetical protein DASC09_020150 [Saccharomycopsis crataegensis]